MSADQEHGVEKLPTDSTTSAAEVTADMRDRLDSTQTVTEDEALCTSLKH